MLMGSHYLISKKVVDSSQKSSSQESKHDQSQSPPPKKQKIIKTTQKNDSDVTQKNPKRFEETEDFIFEDIRFMETENGKIRCGVCEVECEKLILHMNRNKYCTEYFSNMHMFKMKYSKFRHDRSRKKNDGNGRSEDPEGSKKTYGDTIDNSRTIPQNPITKSIPTFKDEKPEPGQKDLENGFFKLAGFEF